MIRSQTLSAVLKTIEAVGNKYNKAYSFPSQERIIQLLSQYHSLDISVRTLNRWLRILEDGNFVTRKRRIKSLGDGGLSFRTTLYTIRAKGYRLLGRMVRVFSGFKKSRRSTEEPQRVNPDGAAAVRQLVDGFMPQLE